jgi:hypothetical protein
MLSGRKVEGCLLVEKRSSGRRDSLKQGADHAVTLAQHTGRRCPLAHGGNGSIRIPARLVPRRELHGEAFPSRPRRDLKVQRGEESWMLPATRNQWSFSLDQLERAVDEAIKAGPISERPDPTPLPSPEESARLVRDFLAIDTGKQRLILELLKLLTRRA